MNKLKHRAIYQGKAYELTGFVYEGKTGIRFWYVAESGNVHNQSGTVETVTILRYTDRRDKIGKFICEGDTVKNNEWPMDEKAPIGKVVFSQSRYECGFSVIGEIGENWYSYSGIQFSWDKLEIIENPELLTK
jgi:hypothetical protein